MGDPARRTLGRAVVRSAALAVLFFVFLGVGKELPSFYLHEPWQDDPYDALVSFDLFALPPLIALCLIRLPLCRADEPLPAARTVGLVRLSRVLVALVGFTVAAQWLSVAVRAHRPAWTHATAGLTVVLATLAVLALGCGWLVHRASRAVGLQEAGPGQPDWLADGVTLAERLGGILRPRVALPQRLVSWSEAALVPVVRRHPVAVAAAVSVAAAAVADGPQVVLEGYGGLFAGYFIGVTACGLFVLCAAVGGYMQVVEQPPGWHAPARYPAVLACAAVPLTAAFRNSLWWLVGTDTDHAGLRALLLLTAVTAAATAATALTVDRLRRSRAT